MNLGRPVSRWHASLWMKSCPSTLCVRRPLPAPSRARSFKERPRVPPPCHTPLRAGLERLRLRRGLRRGRNLRSENPRNCVSQQQSRHRKNADAGVLRDERILHGHAPGHLGLAHVCPVHGAQAAHGSFQPPVPHQTFHVSVDADCWTPLLSRVCAYALLPCANPACCDNSQADLYDFSAKTLDGKDVKFSDYKGKPVLILNVASL